MKLLTTKTEGKLISEIDGSQGQLRCLRAILEQHDFDMYGPLKEDCLRMIEDINHSLYILRQNI